MQNVLFLFYFYGRVFSVLVPCGGLDGAKWVRFGGTCNKTCVCVCVIFSPSKPFPENENDFYHYAFARTPKRLTLHARDGGNVHYDDYLNFTQLLLFSEYSSNFLIKCVLKNHVRRETVQGKFMKISTKCGENDVFSEIKKNKIGLCSVTFVFLKT